MAIVETIKFEGPSDALVWRNTGKEYMLNGDEGINAGSQLIVDEFYEAILFANGNALDLFKPGRHTLITANIPMLKQQYERMTTKTPFPCKVYYVKKTHQFELLWGTKGAIAVDDPVFNIFLHVGCHGHMSISVADSRKFLLKFVGDKAVFTNEDLVANMRGIISARVKDYISKLMILGRVSYFVMNAKLMDVSELVMDKLKTIFDDYGIAVEFFDIESISVPKEDYEQLQAARQRGAGRVAEGITWEKERMYDVLQSAAENEGMAGNMMGAGMGMGMGAGMGIGMGQAMGSISNNVFGGMGSSFDGAGGQGAPMAQPQQPYSVNNQIGSMDVNVSSFLGGQQQQQQQAPAAGMMTCPSCNNQVPAGSRFCSFCGNKFETKGFCPACGAETAPGAMFCSTCGNKLR